MKKVTILRKWDNPAIIISIEDDSIGIEVPLDSFINAVSSEVKELLVNKIINEIGNPSLWFTKESVRKNLSSVLEGNTTKDCLTEAANVVLNAVKLETSKVV